MRTLPRWLGSLLAVTGFAAPAAAHYHILLPDKPATSRDEAVTFTYFFGHPFEHQMFSAQKPAGVTVIAPGGQADEQLAKLERFEVPGVDGKAVTAFRWKYSPTQRGDHVAVVRADPVWMPDEKEFLQDTVTVVLHVQTQNGWDNALGTAMELMPLTRPYGLRPGTVFQVQVLGPPALHPDGILIRTPLAERTQQPLPRTLVEVERYNPVPPRALPPEEHITRTVKTDPNGVATVTLPEPGWWALTAVRENGTREHEGKRYPLKVRSTFWVFVDATVPLTPAK
jgi:cobalt/nickel transport protein